MFRKFNLFVFVECVPSHKSKFYPNKEIKLFLFFTFSRILNSKWSVGFYISYKVVWLLVQGNGNSYCMRNNLISLFF